MRKGGSKRVNLGGRKKKGSLMRDRWPAGWTKICWSIKEKSPRVARFKQRWTMGKGGHTTWGGKRGGEEVITRRAVNVHRSSSEWGLF